MIIKYLRKQKNFYLSKSQNCSASSALESPLNLVAPDFEVRLFEGFVRLSGLGLLSDHQGEVGLLVVRD